MINGVIVVNKPKDWTSHDVVAKLRSIYKQKRIGHTGTLDPMATGVLVVCLGRATKLVDRITDTSKKYFVEFMLGFETDTEDITGNVIHRNVNNIKPKNEEIVDVINSFIGEIRQIPPMYSAIKINGRKLYDIARTGEVIERKPRIINIHSVSNINFNDNGTISMLVECSKGTYIRSLVRDIGRKLNTFATMTSLVRTEVGNFDINDSLSIEDIIDSPNESLLSLESCLVDYNKLVLNRRCDKLLENGNQIPISFIDESLENSEYLVYNSKNELIGIYKYTEKFLMPEIILKD